MLFAQLDTPPRLFFEVKCVFRSLGVLSGAQLETLRVTSGPHGCVLFTEENWPYLELPGTHS